MSLLKHFIPLLLMKDLNNNEIKNQGNLVVNKHQHVERRKHPRYILREGTYAFLRPPANTIGQILDISLSGLAFTYFSTTGASNEPEGLDLLAEGGMSIKNIPFETINDFVIPNELPFSQITMRRRCVKFGDLSADQTLYIVNLIERHQQTEM